MKRVDDVGCRRCDDSGLIPKGYCQWEICTCASGADVLEQRAKRRA